MVHFVTPSHGLLVKSPASKSTGGTPIDKMTPPHLDNAIAKATRTKDHARLIALNAEKARRTDG